MAKLAIEDSKEKMKKVLLRISLFSAILIFGFIKLFATQYWIEDRSQDDVVPHYHWTCGCAPTAAMMVLGYYDFESPTGKFSGYGLLVQQYLERQYIVNYTDASGNPYTWSTGSLYDTIPMTGIYDLARGMGTTADGSTTVGFFIYNIRNGIIEVTNNQRGYSFTSDEWYTIFSPDSLWDTLKDEIDNDRPCIWSCNSNYSWNKGHSVCVVGYTDDNEIIFHNTWDTGWHAYPYKDNGQTWVDLTIVNRGGGKTSDVELDAPDGGESWQAGENYNIAWYQRGNAIDTVYIWYSTNGGYTYSSVGSKSSYLGWNYYDWLIPNQATTHAFVKIVGKDGSSTISCESSINRFTIFLDEDPPTPDPMTWSIVPYEIDTRTIRMMATTASDLSTPIKYYFDYYSSPTGGGGGSNSGWQTSTTYTDYNLQPNHRYGYRVKARDDSINQNDTVYSTISYDYTAIETPSGISFGAVTNNSIQVKSSNTPSGLSRENSGLYFENITNGANSGWKQNNNFWTSGGLSANTRYWFRAKARNGDGAETPYCLAPSKYTLANSPGLAPFSNKTESSIQANWNSNGNPNGTEYYCENVTKGTNSGWISNKYWESTGLSCSSTYSFRVKARNGEGVETSWTNLGDATTVLCHTVSTPNQPSGPTSGITNTSYTYTTGGSVCSHGHGVQYRFDWGDGTYSQWSSSASASHSWANAGPYTVKAQARCASYTSIVSEWSSGKAVTINVPHTVSAPNQPSGPSSGITNTSYTYTTGGASCSHGHGVQYRFDWGDGTYSSWSSSTSASHSWANPGSYSVKAQARCATDNSIVSDWSSGKTVTIGVPHTVSTPNQPSGPSSGITNTSYTYTTGGSVCSHGHSVQYRVDWGDGTYSSWSSSTSASHSWANPGPYTVKAQARCATDNSIVSDWSSGKTVTIGVPHTVSVPNQPSGPSDGITNTSYTYTTGGSVCSHGHGVQYRFDWGDGTYSQWSSSASASHSWSGAGPYKVRAQARCATENNIISGWSLGKEITISCPLPTVPSNPTPPNGATCVSPNPTLNWSSSGATEYDVYFGTNSPPPYVGTTTLPSYSVVTPAETTYLWRIVAKNSCGEAPGPTWSFTTGSAPGAFSYFSPLDGANSVPVDTELDWEDSPGATSYDVYFGTVNPPPFVNTVSSSNYNPGQLNYSTHYYWKVIAVNSCGSWEGGIYDFITIPFLFSDLEVVSLTYSPLNPSTKDLITFTAEVKNIGDAIANSSHLEFKIGSESSPPVYEIPALNPEETYSVERQETLSIAQTYTITATADINEVVAESDETNNVTTDNVTVNPETGSLTVTIEPQGAIDAGAQWKRLCTTTWYDNGYEEVDISAGDVIVEFKDIAGWLKPANQIVTIIGDGSATLTETYKLISGTGELTDTGQNLGSAYSNHVTLGDVDGDGDLDAFVANVYIANTLWINDGNGTFTDSGQSMDSADSLGTILGDINGDGDLDAVVANNGANTVWLNDGNGIFTDSGQNLGDAYSYRVVLGDVDCDGDLDAFFANWGFNKVWINNGNGIFTDSGQSLGNAYSDDIRLGDLDGDGDLDAFVANNYGYYNKVWLNDGTGIFTDSGQNIGISDTHSLGVDLGDLDGDGDLDAFVANSGEPNKVWLNDGNGTFTDSGQNLGSADSLYVGLGDIDADGDLDAVVANYGANTVWLNNGSGIFPDSGLSLGSADSRGVALGDLDNDGGLDAFIANWNNQPEKVWLNECLLPDMPTDPSPEDGATCVAPNPILTWSSSGATEYDVYFGNTSPPPFLVTITNNSYDPGTLDIGTIYYWRIVAKNECGEISGPTWSFTTGSVPGAFSYISPANGATDVPLDEDLDWEDSPMATSYDVYFGTTPSPPYAEEVTISCYDPGRLTPGETYWWKIVAKNSCGETLGFDPWRFTCALGGYLSVTPADGLSSSGLVGGPFSPSSKTYTLENTGGQPIDWEATKIQDWVTLSDTGGTLGVGGTTEVTVSINSEADSLSADTYNDTVSFTNTTNNEGDTTRSVTLTVTPTPGELSVTPSEGLSSSGFVGGAFSPSSKIYTLENTGGQPIDWIATKIQDWVSLSDTGGMLGAGATTEVTVSINSEADSLPSDTYNDTVSFTNTTNNEGDTTRSVTLTVTPTPGELSVTPSEGLSSSGFVGGPFSPSSKIYTLENTGGQPIDWTATKIQDWVSLSDTGGMLGAGATTEVTVSINSEADSLPSDTYNDTVSFTNTTNNEGNTARPVTLTVTPTPGELSVTPSEGLSSSGFVGGPFSPSSKIYTLENTGGQPIDWVASKTQDWVSLSNTGGTLNSGATTEVTVSIDSEADSLSADTYNDTVSFTNTTNNEGDTTRSVTLTVNPAAGELSVTPSEGLSSSGFVGGPFSPSSKIYTLENTGGQPIDWTASKTQVWVSLSDTSGTLDAGATTQVTVSINSEADSLPVNIYPDIVSFTNTTNNEGNTARPVTLTVTPTPGELSVTPSEGLSSSGFVGGPFSPSSKTYTLENTGGQPIDWEATKIQDWVTLSDTGGTLGAGASTEVTVSVNSEANSLLADTYSDIVSFTNTTNNEGDTTRPVILTVGPSLYQIELIEGWNWISFNILPDDLSFNSVFAGILDYIEQIKTQTKSAMQVNGNWIGDLLNMEDISNGAMYKVKSSSDSTISIYGIEITSDLPLYLQENWNWVAYLPQPCNDILSAVSSIFPYVNQVKSQTQSVIKIGNNLIGDLEEMCPRNGYTIKMDEAGDLVYPNPTLTNGPYSRLDLNTHNSVILNEEIPINNSLGMSSEDINPFEVYWKGQSIYPDGSSNSVLNDFIGMNMEIEPKSDMKQPPWTPITGNEYNMIAYGNVYKDGTLLSGTGYYLGSFGPGGEADCRSVSEIEPDGFYYATIRGNTNGDTINFKICDSNTSQILDIEETLTFKSDKLEANFDLNFIPDVDCIISGYVKKSNGDAVKDVMMSGLPNNPQTDEDGFYSDTVSDSWSGTVVPTKTGYSFSPSNREYTNVTSDQLNQDFTASLIQCTLSISSNTGGTTNPSPGSHVYDYEIQVTITALPNSGYTFSGWSGDGSGTDNPITITMDSDKSIAANFSAIEEEEEKAAEEKGPCFIATAAYGSPLHPHIDILRDFRDKYLMANKPGRTFICLYYKYSPFFADLIAKHRLLKFTVRLNLMPLVILSYSIVYLGPVYTAVMLVLLIVIPIFFTWFCPKKRIEALPLKN